MTLTPTRCLCLAAIAMLAATGCSGKADKAAPRGPETTTIAIPYDELLNQKTITREVTLAVGDTLQVSLGANPSTGFQWASDMTISDETVIAQTAHEVLAPANGKPGAAGSAAWALQAVGPGSATVTTTYGRPWPGGEKDAWTFTAAVTVN